MRRLARHAAYVVALLITSTATASAECAWVLWVGEWYDASVDRPSALIQTTATQADCLAALQATAQAQRERSGGDAQIGRDARDPWALAVFREGQSLTIFRCLPDTIDPRKPPERTGAPSAECAWILWMKHDYDAALPGEWTIVRAQATRQDCIVAVQKQFKDAVEQFKAAGLVQAAENMERSAASGSIVFIGQGHSISAKCLPDTVDPRGPKEGAK
jgi:hypothetical protein